MLVILILLLLLRRGLAQMTTTILAVFRAHQRMQYEAAITSAMGILTLVVGILLLEMYPSLIILVIGLVVVELVQLLSALTAYIQNFYVPTLTFNRSILDLIGREGLLLSIAGVSVIIYTRIDVLLLSLYRTSGEVGLYGAAYKVLTTLTLLSTSVLPALYPNLSRAYVRSRRQLRVIFSLAFLGLFTLGVLAAVILSLMAKWLIVHIFGAEFTGSVAAFRILVWAVVFIYTNNLCGVTLNAINKTKINVWIVGVGAIVNVVANIILIPHLGYIATSITTVLTEGFILLACLAYLVPFLRSQEVAR